jgi:exodeoxyribonuclease-3
MEMVKLVSWNVNGLRACLKKDFEASFQGLDADIFCLQETKLQAGQVELDLPGYHQYWNCAEKKGYSGTAVFTRREPLSVRYGMGVEEHDHEGRLITLEFENFFFVGCYTPNAQDGLRRIDYRMQWEDDLRSYLMALDREKPVIYCGDLNVAHEEIDLKNPKTNRGNAGFSDQERGKMTELLASGFTDTFRHLYPDLTGAYSWWSYRFHAREKNAGWRIDYFIVSDRLVGQVQDAKIHSDIFGSDHCPVELDIEV